MKYLRPTTEIHRTELEIDKSRFITCISRATSVEQAKIFIQTLQTEMPDANHHVYAFQVGFDKSVIEGMSDDGEPSGTAGPPTLTVLRGAKLGDIVLVTTRYFGGIKLGKGGLVRAYTDAAKTALASLSVEPKDTRVKVEMTLPYSRYERFLKILTAQGGTVIGEDFAAEVRITTLLPQDQENEFRAAIRDLTAGQATFKLLETLDE